MVMLFPKLLQYSVDVSPQESVNSFALVFANLVVRDLSSHKMPKYSTLLKVSKVFQLGFFFVTFQNNNDWRAYSSYIILNLGFLLHVSYITLPVLRHRISPCVLCTGFKHGSKIQHPSYIKIRVLVPENLRNFSRVFYIGPSCFRNLLSTVSSPWSQTSSKESSTHP